MKHGTYPTIYVSAEGKEVLLGNRQVMRKEAVTVKKLVDNDPLFEHLRVLRKEIADEEKYRHLLYFPIKHCVIYVIKDQPYWRIYDR